MLLIMALLHSWMSLLNRTMIPWCSVGDIREGGRKGEGEREGEREREREGERGKEREREKSN